MATPLAFKVETVNQRGHGRLRVVLSLAWALPHTGEWYQGSWRGFRASALPCEPDLAVIDFAGSSGRPSAPAFRHQRDRHRAPRHSAPVGCVEAGGTQDGHGGVATEEDPVEAAFRLKPDVVGFSVYTWTQRYYLNVNRRQVIGLAYIDEARCIPWADYRDCIVCEEMCPVSDKAIKLEMVEVVTPDGELVTVQRPHVIRERCIGCGICEYKCPVNGEAAIRVYVPPLAW